MTTFTSKPIKNVLIDINGVLFDSGKDFAIDGSVEGLTLLETKFNYCLVTNECTTAKRLLAKKLNNFGYKSVTPSKIVSPQCLAADYVRRNNLIPRYHVWDGVMEDFQPVIDNLASLGKLDEQPNCIVIGDAMTKLSRDFMDESLEKMINSPVKPQIISLGAGRYYKDCDRLRMDTGCYVAAFEFALGVQAINFGKPSPKVFEQALKAVGGTKDDTVMIGDDIVSDVGGAQANGMRGALVRTGKYKETDEQHQQVKADAVFDNLAQAVDVLLQANNA